VTEIKLNAGQHKMLCEALRRYTRFHKDESLTSARTGLTYATYAKPVTDCHPQLMRFGNYQKRCLGWLTLTEHGAKIVQVWLDEGRTYEDIESGWIPPRIVTIPNGE